MIYRRIDYLDVAKGIGIILVVIFHVWRGIESAHLGLANIGWQATDYFVYLFHMPLFFFISGLFVLESLSRGKYAYIYDKVIYIYYPYMLWSIVSIIIASGLSGSVNNPVNLGRILSVPLFPKFHFWFLFILFLYYMIIVFLSNRRALLAIAIVMALLYESSVLQQYAGRQLHFFIFFVAGMLFAEHIGGFRYRNWPLALSFLLLSAVIGFWLGLDTQSAVLVPAGLAGTYLILAISRAVPEGGLRRALGYIGKRSLAIYLLHIIAASGTRIILSKVWHGPSPSILLIVSVVTGLVAPLVAYAVADRLHLLRLAGLGKDRKPNVARPEVEPAL